MPRIRFNLKWLLALMAVASVLAYWVMLPTWRARRFVAAIREHDAVTMLRMLSESDPPPPLGNAVYFDSTELAPWTMQQAWAGRREVNVWIRFGGYRYFVTRSEVSVGAVYW